MNMLSLTAGLVLIRPDRGEIKKDQGTEIKTPAIMFVLF